MRIRPALIVLVATMALAGCSHASEQRLLTQFFAASRLRDLTALQRLATVVFEPARDGVITSFDITAVVSRQSGAEVSIVAPVRLPDGRTATKTLVLTVQDGRVTAVSEPAASPSTPPR